MDVARLPPATQALLRSTVILTSIPQLVSELVQNSIDAGARHIDISVNPPDWSCWVRDDGCGISSLDLSFIGKEGDAGRHGTHSHGLGLPFYTKQRPSTMSPSICPRRNFTAPDYV